MTTRRNVMTGGAALAVAAATVPITANAAPAEDAKLLRLWEEWKVRARELQGAWDHEEAVHKKVSEATGPIWDLVKLIGARPTKAVFISIDNDDPTTKVVPLSSQGVDKQGAEARKLCDDMQAARDKRCKAARAKFGVEKAAQVVSRAFDRKAKIEDLIAETPAEGLLGIAVKLAVWKQHPDHHQPEACPGDAAVESVYASLVKLTGIDFHAQAEAVSPLYGDRAAS